MTVRAYFKLNSLSNTGNVINNDELKQNANITNKEISTNLKYYANYSFGRKSKFISSIIRVPITMRVKGIMIDI